MPTLTTGLMTFEEFEQLPDTPGKLELLEGEVIELPPARSKHVKTGHRMYKRLDDAVLEAKRRGQATELGEAYMEMGYRLSRKSWIQPDVSVTHAHQHEGEYFEGSPAIAIEIISPSNRAEVMETKLDLYFEHGALEVWVAYPKQKRIIVHLRDSYRRYSENESLSTALLPGFEIKVASVFV